ncbi:hypothetical protein [Xenorhabdus griffiniae]|uniref:Uncharacterized protein n=1 Tax=Xenorhabdus griffiniae TaxID=351672 RepID=A0ABY9XD37_9GAMM|nr:hypothetical protein [Xenorhabdus griffiniae]MBD1229210.1 hypothetical protein [Xenorhabdus griffiniae]MBE8588709.1 hypothetical protein [Xenorhabdus griffiniae]WMV70840.1 hypothetical protein QL128_11440 [Xenorhabdus griffiniae]WNH00516.1 hypothetical protein QL112_011445 [Xenorhabdus griffiniae]
MDKKPVVSWKTWLNEPNKAPLFFILNSLARPNPIELFYRNDWVEQAFPLYSDTSMHNLLKRNRSINPTYLTN